MKNGRTLQELAHEIERQKVLKKDFVTDTRNLAITLEHNPQTGTPFNRFSVKGHGFYGITENCHEQIASRLNIPRQYYNRIKDEAPLLYQTNLNHWFLHTPEKRMVRTLDGKARAFLSERYRPLDNFDLAQAVLPIIADLGCKIESCELTERRLYIKAVNQKIEGEIKKGDAVQAGIVISNSEVGCGSVKIEPMVFRLVCLNGMIANDMSMKKYHVGRAGGDLEKENVSVFYKDETRKADDKAFWMKVHDVVEGSLSEAIFKQIVSKMQKAAGQKIDIDPVQAVENVSEKFTMSAEEETGVLKFLVEGGDLTLYGLMNAVTRQSQELPDYDRATDFERFGGQILELPSLVS